NRTTRLASSRRELEHIKRAAAAWLWNVLEHRARDGAEHAEAGRGGDVFLAARSVGDRKSLHRGAETRLPEEVGGLDVGRPVVAIETAHDRHPASRRQHAGQEEWPLPITPDLLHRLHVVRRELRDFPVGGRHLERAHLGAESAAPLDHLYLLYRQ